MGGPSYWQKAPCVERPVGSVVVHAYDNTQAHEGRVFAWYDGAYSANPTVRFDKHSPEKGKLFPPIKWPTAGS